METVSGWDIGGANIKGVRLRLQPAGTNGAGAGIELPFALWRDPGRLADVLAGAAAMLGTTDHVAVTMTAELADCYTTAADGVRAVLDACRRSFAGAAMHVWCIDGRFRTLEDAAVRPRLAAATNWLAAAEWAARHHSDVILLDIGGTTTDIVPIVGGRVAALGRTDTDRLRHGGLVYTGVLRTPVCATLRRVPFRGGFCDVAAEHFAIAADAHVLLGRLAPEEYTCETPDGRGVSRRDAGRRLARMVCGDEETLTAHEVRTIARSIVAAQRRRIGRALARVLDRLGDAAPHSALVAGAGHRLAAEVARRAGLDTLHAGEAGASDARLVPAAAVAHLLAASLGGRLLPAGHSIFLSHPDSPPSSEGRPSGAAIQPNESG